MRWVGILALMMIAGCSAPSSDVITPIPSTPRQGGAQATAERSVAVAVAVGTPTPTAELIGAYRDLLLPRVQRIQLALSQIDKQLAIVQQSPTRLVQDDWRQQMLGILDELAAANAALRTLGLKTGSDAGLSSEMQKLAANLDFVVDEYRLAIDFDPDGTHIVRAGRAEKATADQVDSILLQLRRPAIGPAPTPTR